MKLKKRTLFAFLYLSSCSSYRYYEPTRYEHQLNKFGSLALTNTPQLNIKLIQKEKNQIFIRTRNLIKNISSSGTFRIDLNKGFYQSEDFKLTMSCKNLVNKSASDLNLAADQSAVIECVALLADLPNAKDRFIQAVLPVENHASLEWSFVLKAEDLKP